MLHHPLKAHCRLLYTFQLSVVILSFQSTLSTAIDFSVICCYTVLPMHIVDCYFSYLLLYRPFKAHRRLLFQLSVVIPSFQCTLSTAIDFSVIYRYTVLSKHIVDCYRLFSYLLLYRHFKAHCRLLKTFQLSVVIPSFQSALWTAVHFSVVYCYTVLSKHIVDCYRLFTYLLLYRPFKAHCRLL